MSNIYKYINDEFDRSNIMDNLNKISDELDEELSKDKQYQDKEKRLKLINKLFCEGLKLSTRGNKLW